MLLATPEARKSAWPLACADLWSLGITLLELTSPHAKPPGPSFEQSTGVGTAFFLNLVSAAKELGLVVFIEQCITEQSQAWGASLLRKGLVTGYDAYRGEAGVDLTGFVSFLATV
eukprot:SAG11_NODE_575_length_8420_cov_2.398149_4_plen_115_part_00